MRRLARAAQRRTVSQTGAAVADRDRGRRILLLHIALIVGATLGMIGTHVFTEDAAPVDRHGYRVGVTIVLCWLLYRGSVVARALMVVGLGLAGLLGLVNLLSGSLAAFVVGVSSAVYLSCAVTIAKSSDVRAFFSKQRGRG